jgi:hypothetical protein
VKKYFFLMMVAVVFFAQETLTKVKIDRRIETNLSSLFEALPERIEVFVTSDSTYIVEAFFPDKKSVKRMTSAEYRDLIVRKPAKLVTIESAQISYLVGQTFIGLALYSWSLPVMFSEDDFSEGMVTLGLLTPLLYTSSIFLATSHRRISSGAAYGSFLGGIEGAFHGGIIFNSGRGVFPVSLTENMLDFTLGQKMGFTPAMYQRKFNHCAYGYYHYFAANILFTGEDVWGNDEDIMQIGTLLSLGEGYSSLFFSRNAENLTFGDALFELRMSAMGAEALPLILATIDSYREGSNTDDRVYAGLSLLGHCVGYLCGYKFTRDYDLPGAAGVMVWILPYLAHATTGGLVLLSDSEGFSDAYPAIYLGTDILLTFACYKAFAKKSTDVGKADIPNFNISINPMCFMFKDKDKDKNFSKMPFLSFSYNFD